MSSQSGQGRQQLEIGERTGELRLEAWMLAQLIGWVRRADGGGLAVVLMPAGSANDQSTATMQLWLEPDLITTDLTTGQ